MKDFAPPEGFAESRGRCLPISSSQPVPFFADDVLFEGFFFFLLPGLSGGGVLLDENSTMLVINFLMPASSKSIVVCLSLTSTIVPSPYTEWSMRSWVGGSGVFFFMVLNLSLSKNPTEIPALAFKASLNILSRVE